MNNKAICIFIMLIATSLSGCTGSGDGPQFELSSDEIQDIIDDNLDDFLNNTTITIVNNYYNNTTIDQSGTSNPSSEINNYNGTGRLYSSSGTVTGNENIYVPSGMAVLLVRESAFQADAAGNSVSGLSGANICVGIGTAAENEIQGWFSSINQEFTAVGTADEAEGTDKLIAGECDAMYFGSFFAASQKKQALDQDGSIEGDVWIASASLSNDEINTFVGNSLSISIQQDEDEMLTGFEYAYAQVTLNAICMENLSEDCIDDEYIFTTNTWGVTMNSETTCSGNLSLSSSSGYTQNYFRNSEDPYIFFAGAGLNCTHDFTLVIDLSSNSQLTLPLFISGGYPNENYELSWSDWTYSFVWESVPLSSE